MPQGLALASITSSIDSVVLLLLQVIVVGDTLIDGPTSVTYLPNIGLVQVCVRPTITHHTRE